MVTVLTILAVAALMIFIVGVVFAAHFPLQALLACIFFSFLFVMFAFALLPSDRQRAMDMWINIDLDNALTTIPLLIFLPPAASLLAGSVVGWTICAARALRRRTGDKRAVGQF